MKEYSADEDFKALDFSLLKRLLVYLKPYKKHLYLAIMLTLLTSALTPLRPYLTKIAIDDYISVSDGKGLMTIIILIFIVMIASGILNFIQVYLMNWVGQNVLFNIRIKLFCHIQALSLKFFDKNPVGRLVTRVTNDIDVLNELFSSGVVMIISDLLLLCWIIGYMFAISWELTLLTLTVLPFLFAATFIFKNKVRVVSRDIRKTAARLNSFLNEFITGNSTVKLFTREKKQFALFDEINLLHRNLWMKNVFYYALFFPVIEMLGAIVLGIILWFTAGNILSGSMTVGILIAYLQYAEMFFRPIRDLTEKYTTFQSAMASSERIFGLLDTKVFVEEAENAQPLYGFKDKIEFRGVCFSYEDNKPVLKNVSFNIEKGETVAIVGATGAGKTSLINLLCRFYEFQDGTILIDGRDIRKITNDSLLSGIALVMQDVFLFSRTISENISLGSETISNEDVKNSAEALGAADFISKIRGNYDSMLNERGTTLSSGQRQLLSFCRAYVAKPEILILDEATSNIDSETEHIIENSLEKLLEGRTSLIIAHRLSTIKRANKIVVMHHGEVKEIGSHSELLEKNGIYARLYQLQYKNGTAAV